VPHFLVLRSCLPGHPAALTSECAPPRSARLAGAGAFALAAMVLLRLLLAHRGGVVTGAAAQVVVGASRALQVGIGFRAVGRAAAAMVALDAGAGRVLVISTRFRTAGCAGVLPAAGLLESLVHGCSPCMNGLLTIISQWL
jgi:hypothetical protein